VDAFRPSLVDVPIHGRFAYPLAGAHRATACDACHVESKLAAKRSSLVALHGPGPTMTFATKSQACEACHATPHGDQFAARNDRGACDSCHGDDSFRPAGRFDHQKDASFPLDGAHVRVACARCHASRPGADGKPLVLYRSLPHRCEDCHRAGGMSPPLRPKSRGSEKS
jgi:hypothetical protein